MIQIKDNLTILFADISRSTTLYDTLGDEKAHDLTTDCLSLLSKEVGLFGGEIVKTMGDGIMCSFTNASSAAGAAVSMMHTVDTMAAKEPDVHAILNIRIGFQSGYIIREENDIFGDAVNVAARMAALAKPRQVITALATVELLNNQLKEKARFVDRTMIRGKSGEFDIYEIIWEEGDQTIIMSSEPPKSEFESFMYLENLGRQMRIDLSNPAITIGRQDHNDIVINENLVSRTHCRIEYHKGRFICTDQSSNGSYIHSENGHPVFIHNDQFILDGRGHISLGYSGIDKHGLLVSFQVINK